MNNVTMISVASGGFDASSLPSAAGIGYEVAGLGDLDGDGVPEIALGTVEDSVMNGKGCVYILFLNSDGTVKRQTKIGNGKGGFPAILDVEDRFGGRVNAVGDLDGDGLPELAVYAGGDDEAGTDYGATYILFLRSDGTVRRYSKITTGVGGFTGTIGGADGFGPACGIGDVDHDGVQDLLVSELDDDDGGTGKGAVWIMFMDRDGTVKAHQKLSATSGGLAPVSWANSQNFGRGITGIGDLDLDGVEDIAVSTHFEDSLGSLYILFLNADGTVKSKQKIGRSGAGGLSGTFHDFDGFAFSVACVGDLDGDGIQDLAAGTRLYDETYTDAGAVFLLYMNRNGTVKSQKIIANSSNVPAPLGLEASAQFGFAVDNVGDVDGDGTTDLGVVARTEDEGGTDKGSVRILFLHGPLKAGAEIGHVTNWLDSIGTIALQPLGGKGPFTYDWSDGDSVAVREDLLAGDYTVTITDALGDQVTRTYTVGPRTQLTSVIGVERANGLWRKVTANGWGNAGFSTQKTIPLGGTGYVRTTVEQADAKFVFGVDSLPVDTAPTSMPYYFLVENGTVDVYTQGVARLVGPLPSVQVGDVLKITKQASGGGSFQLVFSQNGTTLHTAAMGSDEVLHGNEGGFTTDAFYGDVLMGVDEFVPEICEEPRAMNTVTELSYDLNGDLIGLAKVFNDDLGRTVQTQAYDFENHNVIATATVYDLFGRPVLTTLPVPIFQAGICYKEDLITADSGDPYDHTKFDVPDHTTSASVLTAGEVDKPKAVDRTTQGTLGWYYSNNNTAEPLTPTADRPYSRVQFNELTLGQTRRVAAVGSGLETGSGHERYGFTMPAAGELYYVFGLARSWFTDIQHCTAAGLGDPACWLQGQDAEADAENVGWNVVWGGNTLTDRAGYQVLKTISRDPNGKERVSFTDLDGKLVATCYSGAVAGVNRETQHVTSVINEEGGNFVDIHLPAGCENSLVLFQDGDDNFNYRIVDLATGEAIDFSSGGPADYVFNGTDPDLPPGSYRIFLASPESPTSVHEAVAYHDGNAKMYKALDLDDGIPVEYDLNYYDFALNYYDRAGRLVQVVPPNGVDHLDDLDRIDPDEDLFDVGLDDAGGASPNWTLDDGPDPYDRIVRSLDQATDEHSQFSNLAISLLTTVKAADTDVKSKKAPATSSHKPLGAKLKSLTYEVTSSTPGPGRDPSLCVPCFEQRLFCPEPQCPGSDGTSLGMHAEEVMIGGTTCWTCVENTAYDARYIIDFDVLVEVHGPSTPLIPIASGLRFDAIRNQGQWAISTNSAVPDPADRTHHVVIDPQHSAYTSQYVVRVNTITERVYDAGSNSYVDGEDYTYLHELSFRIERETFAFSDVTPQHTMASKYMYNTLDQQVAAYDPDAGLSLFAYRTDGKLRFSQNAQQRADNEFSYTNYDPWGRVVEFGVYDRDAAGAGTARFFTDQYGQISGIPAFGTPTTSQIIDDPDGLDDGRCKEVTHIQYDAFDPTEFEALTGYAASAYRATWLTGRVATSWNEEVRTWYSYDEYGRVTWAVMKYSGDLPVKTIDYQYDAAGRLASTTYQAHNQPERFVHLFSYDADQRIKKVHTQHTEWTGSFYQTITQEEAEYAYYLHGPLKRVEIAQNAQGVDFLYTINGWLKAINSPDLGRVVANSFRDPGRDSINVNGVRSDLFGEVLDYFSGDYLRAGSYVSWGQYTAGNDQYNGNLKSVRWSSQGAISAGLDPSGDIPLRTHNIYAFTYNDKDWLKTATYGRHKSYVFNLPSGVPQLPSEQETAGAGTVTSNAYKLSGLSYDPCGNLLAMTRSGTSDHLPMDQFAYRYLEGTNRLLSVKDAAGATPWTTEDLEDQDPSSTYDPDNSATWNYQYDHLGRMVENKGDDQKLKYNAAGLVTEVRSLSSNLLKVQYAYDQTGRRIRKTDYDGSGDPTLITWYVNAPGGGMLSIYEQQPGSTTVLQAEVPIGGNLGTMYAQAGHVSLYALKDHLGNVRATFTRSGTLESWTDYEPWGMPMVGRMAVGSLTYRYGFQGQETDQIGGVRTPAFQLRLWDSRIGRWNTTDPYRQYWSPYVGMGNRPHSTMDPDGGFAIGGTFATALIRGAVGAGVMIGISAFTKGDDESVARSAAIGFAIGFGSAYAQAGLGKLIAGGKARSLLRGISNADATASLQSVTRVNDWTKIFNETLSLARNAAQIQKTRNSYGWEPMSGLASRYAAFYLMVHNGAQFDIKKPENPNDGDNLPELTSGYNQENIVGRGENAFYSNYLLRYDDFGNYVYGLMGRIMGIPLERLWHEAGAAQQRDDPSKSDPNNWIGNKDEMRDTIMIYMGYKGMLTP